MVVAHPANDGCAGERHGREKLDQGPSYVLASNHQSIYDIPILFASLPLRVHSMASLEPVSVPWLAPSTNRASAREPQQRRRHRRQDAAAGERIPPAHRLSRRTRSIDGRVGRFKKGSFLVAIDAGLPIVPISVTGSRHVMLKGRLMVRPGDVRVTVHDPIPTAGVTRPHIGEFVDRVREIVHHDVDEPVTVTEVERDAGREAVR